MSGFLYYVPGRNALTADQAAEIGLGYAFGAGRCQCCPVTAGPGEGGSGVVFADPQAVGNIKFEPQQQTWLPTHLGGDAWVGIWNAAPPAPESLARDPLIPGLLVRDENGGHWMAPTARRWQESDGQIVPGCGLPLRLTRDDSGAWTRGQVKPRYQRLWRLVMAYETARYAAAENASDDGVYLFSFDEINELAILTLQVNYRVAGGELDLLGVFDEQFRQAVADAAIDRQRLEALLGAAEDGKKKEPSGAAE